MNNIIIGVAGYTLLFSNFLLLMVHIKKKCKHRSVSSVHILSISDILNSLLTGIILLINYVDITDKTNHFYNNKLPLNTDTADKYTNAFLQLHETYNLSGTSYYNKTSCNVKNLLMHNAMFLIPFTNAFISLLIFAIQCNLNATCINNKYKNYLQFWMKRKQDLIMETGNQDPENEELKTKKEAHQNILSTIQMKHKISKVFLKIRYKNITEKNKGIIGISVLSQWLIPFFLTGTLYMSDYQNIGMMLQNKSIECMYRTPFFFYNCFLEDEDIVLMENTHPIIPIYMDYASNESLIPLFDQNVTKNDVISKIYDIMNLAVNNTYNSTNNERKNNLNNNYELLKLKRNVNARLITNDIINSINNTYLEINQWITTDEHNIESSISISKDISTTQKNYEDVDERFEFVILSAMNECIIPTTFLRLYFLMLMFIMYFLPIMLSSVLQVRGKLVCQNILNKLKEQNTILYSIPQEELHTKYNDKVLLKTKLSGDSYSKKEYNNEGHQSTSSNIISDHTYDHDKMHEEILKKSMQVEQLFGMIKASLIVGVMSWTPIFLQAALQVFLCIYVSTWIIDCTFVCAISNCITRNIFNLNMVNIQETQENLCRKENTIHPSEENI